MTDLTWLIALIWLVFIAFYLRSRQTMVGGTAAAIGTFFGLTLIDDAIWLGLTVIVFSLYLFYASLIGGDKRK